GFLADRPFAKLQFRTIGRRIRMQMKIFDLFLAATRVAAASTFILTATVCHAEPWFNESELDTLFAAKNWKELSAALSRPDRDEKKALHWMKTKLVSSGSYLIALLYARDLWLVGSAVPAADPNKDLRI